MSENQPLYQLDQSEDPYIPTEAEVEAYQEWIREQDAIAMNEMGEEAYLEFIHGEPSPLDDPDFPSSMR